jgi:methylglutaconyl-CoA hydratase
MNEESVVTEKSDGIATVTLNRPDVHNAFSDEVIGRLQGIVKDVRAAGDVRGLFLKANGKSFSAGADLNWMKRAADYSYDENLADANELGALLADLYLLPFLTVALVQGPAIAGGLGLVAACDVAVASESAWFAVTEVRIGLLPAVISPHVVRAIGPRAARRYFLTGERFSVDDAHRLGLVHEIVGNQEELDAAEQRLRKSMLSTAAGAVADTKKLIEDVELRPLTPEIVADTAARIASRRVTDEGKEGIASFLEKRKPKWASGS